MADIDLDELERLAAQATLGPWSRYGDIHIRGADGFGLGYLSSSLRSEEEMEKNVRYIVAACNAVPGLIKRVRELEYQLGEVEFDNSGLCREIDALKRQRNWLAARFGGEHDGVPASEYFLQLAEQAAKEEGNA